MRREAKQYARNLNRDVDETDTNVFIHAGLETGAWTHVKTEKPEVAWHGMVREEECSFFEVA